MASTLPESATPITGARKTQVAVEMNFPGATLDQYDQVIKKMGLTPAGATPPGAISHWIAKTDDGLRVVDVWESREQFDRYAEEKIRPYTREAGFTEAPEMRFYDVHNYLTTQS
jgi:hypothetical protein